MFYFNLYILSGNEIFICIFSGPSYIASSASPFGYVNLTQSNWKINLDQQVDILTENNLQELQ